MRPTPSLQSRSLHFVLLLGVVSLLADATYEGARSITGPYLGALGAGAAVVGFVAGLGEMTGYGLRLFSGLLADRTRRYWAITIGGYLLNLAAVPLLALAGSWQVAAVLIIAERAGKAMRTPARDAMLSHAATNMGRGWAFGLHEALDQAGAVGGPLVVAWALAAWHGYAGAFALLGIPAALAIAALLIARTFYPRPRDLEIETAQLTAKRLPALFWIYVAASALLAAGYADFALIAFHLERQRLIGGASLAVVYAAAMAGDGLAALLLGRLYDRWGIGLLSAISLLVAPFGALVFLSDTRGTALAGLALWATGMGAQESVLRAAIGELAPAGARASAYGIFHAAFGLSWFAGSALLGLLYGISRTSLAAFCAGTLLAAAVLFLLAGRAQRAGIQP